MLRRKKRIGTRAGSGAAAVRWGREDARSAWHFRNAGEVSPVSPRFHVLSVFRSLSVPCGRTDSGDVFSRRTRSSGFMPCQSIGGGSRGTERAIRGCDGCGSYACLCLCRNRSGSGGTASGSPWRRIRCGTADWNRVCVGPRTGYDMRTSGVGTAGRGGSERAPLPGPSAVAFAPNRFRSCRAGATTARVFRHAACVVRPRRKNGRSDGGEHRLRKALCTVGPAGMSPNATDG